MQSCEADVFSNAEKRIFLRPNLRSCTASMQLCGNQTWGKPSEAA